MGRRLVRARTGLGLLAGAVLLAPMAVSPPLASAATLSHGPSGPVSIEDRNYKFTYDPDISIPANGTALTADGTAPAYPSTLSVTAKGTIVDLDVELQFNHGYPHGVDVLLVGPDGRQAVVLSDAGPDQPANPLYTLTLDDEADSPVQPVPPATVLVTRDYRPTNNAPADTFPTPAPSVTGASALSVFDGMDPNGPWQLFVFGDGAPSGGTLRSWSLDFDTNHTASPYPSTIDVSGSTSGVSDVNLTLHGLTHGSVSDIDLMLVAPGGRRAVIMSNAAAPATGAPPTSVSDLTLTLDDEAASSLPTSPPLPAGTYKPANYGFIDDTFPTPAPPRPADNNVDYQLSVFDGIDPNGTWRLFVLDTHHGVEGTLAGWSLQITTPGAPAAPNISAPASGSTDRDGAVDLTGTAPPSSTVRVFEGGTLQSITTAAASGAWSTVIGGVGDGAHTYHAVASDSFGNTSSPSGAVTVVMDRAAPTGSVTVEDGAPRTNRASVTLNLSATDPAPGSGVAQMRFSNDAVTWSAFEPYARSNGWTLPGADGTKTVYAQFADRAGNISLTDSDTIVLDTSGSGSGGSGSGADSRSPRVTSTRPGGQATGVKPSANVKAVFSEAMEATTVNRLNVRLLAPDGGKVKARISYDKARRTVRVNPRADLARRATYRVVIGAVRDLAGNPLDQKPKAGDQPKRWRFTTR